MQRLVHFSAFFDKFVYLVLDHEVFDGALGIHFLHVQRFTDKLTLHSRLKVILLARLNQCDWCIVFGINGAGATRLAAIRIQLARYGFTQTLYYEVAEHLLHFLLDAIVVALHLCAREARMLLLRSRCRRFILLDLALHKRYFTSLLGTPTAQTTISSLMLLLRPHLIIHFY